MTLDWYNAATPTGLLLAYVLMAAGGIMSYLWSIAHLITTVIIFLGVSKQLVLHFFEPTRYPLHSFFLVKAISILVSSVMLLLIRWEVGVLGQGGGAFHYNHMGTDTPPAFHYTSWAVIMSLLYTNIAEAIAAEWYQNRGRLNCLVGALLLVAFPFQRGTYQFTITWILAYGFWNMVFVLRRFGRRAGLVQLGHILIPQLVTTVFHIPDAWVYLRCQSLGVFLAVVDHPMTSWAPHQSAKRKETWAGPSEANKKHILDPAMTLMLQMLAVVCLLGCWIPNDYVV